MLLVTIRNISLTGQVPGCILCEFQGINPMTQSNIQAPKSDLLKVYITLSELADKFSLKADDVKPCTDEWFELIGQRMAYRQAAIIAINAVIEQNADSNS